jgi:hypothetical protein
MKLVVAVALFVLRYVDHLVKEIEGIYAIVIVAWRRMIPRRRMDVGEVIDVVTAVAIQ